MTYFHTSKSFGIGISLRWDEQNNKVLVGEVWQGSPAAHSGLIAVGDYITRGILYCLVKLKFGGIFSHHIIV